MKGGKKTSVRYRATGRKAATRNQAPAATTPTELALELSALVAAYPLVTKNTGASRQPSDVADEMALSNRIRQLAFAMSRAATDLAARAPELLPAANALCRKVESWRLVNAGDQVMLFGSPETGCAVLGKWAQKLEKTLMEPTEETVRRLSAAVTDPSQKHIDEDRAEVRALLCEVQALEIAIRGGGSDG